MTRARKRSTAAGVAIGSVGLAVGVVGSVPTLTGADAATTVRSSDNAAAVTTDRPDRPRLFALDLRNRARHGGRRSHPTSTAAPKQHRRHHARPARAHRPARAERASRSTRRVALPRDPKALARMMLAARGWSSTQWTCLDALWTRESSWQVHATNASSGAYGIPQSLPGSKMATAGSDWRDNPATQIRWGLGYIAAAYGTPCGAWAHSQSYGFY